MELISRILSLQLAGNSSVIITDRTLVHRFHGLRDVKIINVQLVQGMSESGAVGDRMQPVDRAHRLARVSSLLGETVVARSSGWMLAASLMIAFCRLDTAPMYCA